MKKTVKRVERQIITRNDVNADVIDNLCFLSKNLYNSANYVLRQVYFGKLDNIPDFKNVIKEFKIKDKIYYKIDEYDLSQKLLELKQVDYKSLPSQVSQQIIKLLYKNWKSFFRSIKSYKQNPEKFKGIPKKPKYKEKDGRNIIVFTNQQCHIKNNLIYFAKLKQVKVEIVNDKFEITLPQLEPFKTNVTKIDQIRIIPQTSCYLIEIVYTKEVEYCKELNDKLYLGIDVGVNNLATCVNNAGLDPFIVNGKIVKSINQYYNKQKAYLQGFIYDIGSTGTSKRIKRLYLKRNNKIHDYFHKTSRYIINYCLKNDIKTIIIGHNKDQKQEINMSKQNNQNFVSIPYCKLIGQLRYKGEEVGIELIETEESYTSKCSLLDSEEMKHSDNYLGKRIHRGQFRSKEGRLINCDVQAGCNIIRKVVPKVFNDQGIEGLKLNPIRINVS